MKNRVIEQFNTYHLHDVGVVFLNMNFAENEIEIKFRLWDDLQSKEAFVSYKFSGISKFQSEYHPDFEFVVTGCHLAECSEIETDKYEASFVFELKYENRDIPAWEVVIGFTGLELIGGLSEEALKYKYEC